MTISLDQRVATAFYGSFAQLRDAQHAAIEPLVSGRNIVLTSATGSGKTEAVMAPLVSRYWQHALATGTLFLLYIAPTKALVNDLERRLHPPLAKLGLHVGVRHGDRDDLTRGPKPHVLVTTPESLDVLLLRREQALRSVKAVVIDEVHLLYNTQRGLQLSILLRRLRGSMTNPPQWAALSATVEDLAYVREFLVGSSEEADLLSYPAQRPIDAQIRHIRSMPDLLSLARKLTAKKGTKLLVFADSRRECERLSGTLQEDEALRRAVFAHYSSLSPELREDTERRFASMDTAICVATSTLELGIDIGDIDAILLWGVPGSVESMLQRIGRGTRRSNKANVVCMVTDQSSAVPLDGLRFAALIEAASRGELPNRQPYELFGAVGQQCLSAIASEGGRYTQIAALLELMAHKPYINRTILESILAELASNGFLQRHGYLNRYGADEELYRLVDTKLIYGNFGVGSQTVDLYYQSKHLGEIPAMNLLRVQHGACVRFAGKSWKVGKISRDGIFLEPSPSSASTTEFSYGGRGAPSDPHNADRVWRLLHADEFPADLFSKDFRGQVEVWRESLRRLCSEDQIPFRRVPEGIRYFTFAGAIVNRAVALHAKKLGSSPEDISLLVPSPLEWDCVPSQPSDFEDFFHLLFEASSRQSLYQKQLPLELQEREYLQDWLKDLTIPRILDRLSKSTEVNIDGAAWP